MLKRTFELNKVFLLLLSSVLANVNVNANVVIASDLIETRIGCFHVIRRAGNAAYMPIGPN